MTQIKYEFAKLKWVDSSIAANGWVLLDDIKDFSSTEIETVGYIVHQNDIRYLIAQSIGRTHIQGVISIPKCMIIDLNIL